MAFRWLWLGLLLRLVFCLFPVSPSRNFVRQSSVWTTASSLSEEEEPLDLIEPPLPEDRLRYCARVMYDGSGFR